MFTIENPLKTFSMYSDSCIVWLWEIASEQDWKQYHNHCLTLLYYGGHPLMWYSAFIHIYQCANMKWCSEDYKQWKIPFSYLVELKISRFCFSYSFVELCLPVLPWALNIIICLKEGSWDREYCKVRLTFANMTIPL